MADPVSRCPAAAEKEKALYTVLEQQAAQVGAAGIMGSDHTYVIPGAEEPRRAGAAARKRCAPSARYPAHVMWPLEQTQARGCAYSDAAEDAAGESVRGAALLCQQGFLASIHSRNLVNIRR